MDSERWKQVDDVLQSVLDREPEERDAFLRQACAGDETLEQEVRSLLSSEEQAGKFLQNPALEVAARAMARRERRADFPTTSPTMPKIATMVVVMSPRRCVRRAPCDKPRDSAVRSHPR